MNTAIFGIITAITITVYACLSTTDNHDIFLDKLGILIVLGGTISAAAITFNLEQLRKLGYNFLRVLTREVYDAPTVVNEIVETAKILQNNPSRIKGQIDKVEHPFMKDGLRLVHNGFDANQIEVMLKRSVIERKGAHLAQVDVLRSIAKYPPAFGMIGTVIGLVALLQSLSAEGGIEKIGPNMAVALVTTLYGLLVANFIFIPMSENLFNKVQRDIQIRRIIIEGILLMKKGEDIITIQETLNAYLHPSHRTDVVTDLNIGSEAA